MRQCTDLIYVLLDDYDLAVLVHAIDRGEAPGTLFVIEPERAVQTPDPSQGAPFIEGHNLDPAKILTVVASLGGNVRRVLVASPGLSTKKKCAMA